jgi:lysophospholipase L1-like esterase
VKRGVAIVGWTVLSLALFFLSAELVTRVQDWRLHDVPFKATPDTNSELKTRVNGLLMGRPQASFGKYQLDSNGFREVAGAATVPADCPRIFLIGASETFGVFESPGKEYASVLQRKLNAAHRCLRLVNTAVAGMSLTSQLRYWDEHLVQLRPAAVVIYPSPQFYLKPATSFARNNTQRSAADVEPVAISSRFLTNLRAHGHKPQALQLLLDHRAIQAALRTSHLVEQTEPSAQGLSDLSRDLSRLIARIEESRIPVYLVIPGHRSDEFALTERRVSYPDIPEAVIARFMRQADAAIKQVGVSRGLTLIDLNASLSDHNEYFVDQVHPTDAGAARIAEIMAPLLTVPDPRLPAQVNHAVQ